MLSLFKVRPPLTVSQRVKLELLLRRTLDAVGRHTARQAEIVTDLAELRLDHTTADRLCDSAKTAVAARLPLTQRPVAVEIVDPHASRLAASYQPGTETRAARIQIDRETLTDPLRTVTTLASQLATHFWYSFPGVSGDEMGPELSDLLPMVCGLGVLAAEAACYDRQWTDRGWQGWSMSRSGYYNTTEIGYVLALLARCRNESAPNWLRAARLDARATAQRALRYFCCCDRDHVALLFDAMRVPGADSSPAELAAWLAGDHPEFALAAGYVLDRGERPGPQMVAAAVSAAAAKQDVLMPILVRLIARAGESSERSQRIVRRAIASNQHETSVAGLLAAESLGMNLTAYRQRIRRLLASYADGSRQLIALVGRGGPAYASLQPIVCQHLVEAIRFSHQDAIGELTDCLSRISSDPRSAIEREIRDPEIRDHALQALARTPSLSADRR